MTQGKKRKRTDGEVVMPSEKPTTQVSENIVVSVVPNSDELAPVIASTPGLTFPSSIGLRPFIKRRKNAAIRPGSVIATELLLQSSEHPTIDYLGREVQSGTDGHLRHYVGVYDPATGELELMEARKIVVRGTVRSRQAGPEAMTGGNILASVRDQRTDLGQTFGTKKARNAIASLTENAISTPKKGRQPSDGSAPNEELDSNAKAILSSINETTSAMATREELSAVVDNSKPRPKANLVANKIEDVYTIETLIGVEILKLVPVNEWLDAVKDKKEILTKSRFVSHRLQKVAPDVQKLKVLRYLLCLLSFFQAARPKGREIRIVPKKEGLRAALSGIPEVVVESIRRKFSDHGQMQKFEVDFLITHICVLALLVDNFEVDVYDLMEDLQLEVKKISQYFHEIGAKVVGLNTAERTKLHLDKAIASQHKIARLRLPLDFPKTRFVRK